VTAIETHFWWADLPSAMGEIFRVVKPGGKLVIIAEVYKASGNAASRLAEKYSAISGMKLLSVAEHEELFLAAGFQDVQIITKPEKGWICGIGAKAQ